MQTKWTIKGGGISRRRTWENPPAAAATAETENKQTNEEGQDEKRSLWRQLNCIGIGIGQPNKQNKQGEHQTDRNGTEPNRTQLKLDSSWCEKKCK